MRSYKSILSQFMNILISKISRSNHFQISSLTASDLWKFKVGNILLDQVNASNHSHHIRCCLSPLSTSSSRDVGCGWVGIKYKELYQRQYRKLTGNQIQQNRRLHFYIMILNIILTTLSFAILSAYHSNVIAFVWLSRSSNNLIKDGHVKVDTLPHLIWEHGVSIK